MRSRRFMVDCQYTVSIAIWGGDKATLLEAKLQCLHYTYIYIYIYVCVCVCVCVSAYTHIACMSPSPLGPFFLHAFFLHAQGHFFLTCARPVFFYMRWAVFFFYMGKAAPACKKNASVGIYLHILYIFTYVYV